MKGNGTEEEGQGRGVETVSRERECNGNIKVIAAFRMNIDRGMTSVGEKGY